MLLHQLTNSFHLRGLTRQSALAAFLVQVLTALCKLDAMNIIHANVNPVNIMLVTGWLQAREESRLSTLTGICSYIHTRFYQAPEIPLGKTHADIYFFFYGTVSNCIIYTLPYSCNGQALIA